MCTLDALCKHTDEDLHGVRVLKHLDESRIGREVLDSFDDRHEQSTRQDLARFENACRVSFRRLWRKADSRVMIIRVAKASLTR